MKHSNKFERLPKEGEGTSSAQPIDEPPLKTKYEPQISDQSTNLESKQGRLAF